jgi:signal transduction histidine kinase
VLRTLHSNLRLRTKLLSSLVLVTATLTGATLLTVRHSARAQAQRQIEQDARNAILTIQSVQQQHELMLGRKADLLAMLAYLRGGDPSAVEDASGDPWQSGDCDLFALANNRGKIVALHASNTRFSADNAEELLKRALTDDSRTGWWFHEGHVFHVVLQPFYEDQPLKSRLLGTVIVGRELDSAGAHNLGRISSSDLVLRYGDQVVINTLGSAQNLERVERVPDSSAGKQIHIGKERFFARTITLGGGVPPAITLTVLKSYDDAEASLRKLNHLLLGLGLAALFAGGLLVFVIADRFTRPLSALADGVRALEHGDYAYPLNANGSGGDEVARLTRAFREMRSTLERDKTQKEQLEGQLRQAQKMDAIGRLAGGVAHDFNNLLTVIKGNSGLLAERLPADERLLGCTRQIEGAADRAVSLTRQLLAFCRMQVLQPKILDLNQLVSEMCKLLRRLVREDIAFVFEAGESLGRVKADPGQVEQVIMNLVVNAGDAMPAGGRLTVETRNVTADEKWALRRPPIVPGDYVLLAVTDNGQGMDAETKARIFEPFFTTKEQGKGTGLGLATVYGIVKQSAGCIWVESEPGKGARFEIYLPRVYEAQEAPAVEKTEMARIEERKTVLIAEDEQAVRDLASEFLESAGYTVLTAKDGGQALNVAEHSDAPIDVLLTDVVMPRMRGTELAKRLRKSQPDLTVVYMTGYFEYKRNGDKFLEEDVVLQKPFTRATLVAAVRLALDRVRAVQQECS